MHCSSCQKKQTNCSNSLASLFIAQLKVIHSIRVFCQAISNGETKILIDDTRQLQNNVHFLYNSQDIYLA